MDISTILRHGTPVYVTDPGTAHTGSNARARRHAATIARPMRDYGRNTASYYEVRLHNGQERVYSADFVEVRYEGKDAQEWHAA